MNGQGAEGLIKILTVFGTRPEAIKMAPVVIALASDPRFDAKLCVTGQHAEMLESALDLFEIKPDFDLKIMRVGQGLPEITTAVIEGLQPVLASEKPDYMLVHGDTTTCMAAALAGFYAGIKIGHVEAGLRSYDLHAPWPEEANRQLTARLAALHFAPTARARDNLLRENIADDQIYVTGNTVIDALHMAMDRLRSDHELAQQQRATFPFLDDNKRLILVTGHRRENQDGGLGRIAEALVELAMRGDVQIIYPVHPNPVIADAMRPTLEGVKNIFLIEPQAYLPFVWLLNRADIILTDSGGIQEEAASLGKPVLVLRETTERPEAVCAGIARLIGTDRRRLVEEVEQLLDDPARYRAMAHAHNLYGDGMAATRIVDIIAQISGLHRGSAIAT